MREWKLRRKGKENMCIHCILVFLFLCYSMQVIATLDECWEEKENTSQNSGWRDVKQISLITVVWWMASLQGLPPYFPCAWHCPPYQMCQSVGCPTKLVTSPRWRVSDRGNMAAAWTPHTEVLRLHHSTLPANMILQLFCEGQSLDRGSVALFSSSTPFWSVNSTPI